MLERIQRARIRFQRSCKARVRRSVQTHASHSLGLTLYITTASSPARRPWLRLSCGPPAASSSSSESAKELLLTGHSSGEREREHGKISGHAQETLKEHRAARCECKLN